MAGPAATVAAGHHRRRHRPSDPRSGGPRLHRGGPEAEVRFRSRIQLHELRFREETDSDGDATIGGTDGVCWDNAMAESFFSALENEWLHRVSFATRADARRAVVKYIETFCNRIRLHSGLGYKAPLQVHAEFLNQQMAA
ncbi:integrase core domain-containing protein [Nocardia sp. NPDC101769]|uniref:integrase core domain-containing protein n=1 Tax=Nocardia sp. NPDC101769 TaxID=3364333 RepID=UPI003800ADDF